jgi:enamine deaminase RidA (YjgF/YER057c/UK114 family)
MTSDTTPPAESTLEYLQPAGLGKPEEPYSLAIRAGNQLFLAGQVAFDENNQLVGAGDPRKQAEQCWRNIELAIKAAGGTLANVVKITVYYKDIRYMHDEIAVRQELFAEGRYPVCTIVQIGNLGLPELLMEIDATVVLDAA